MATSPRRVNRNNYRKHRRLSSADVSPMVPLCVVLVSLRNVPFLFQGIDGQVTDNTKLPANAAQRVTNARPATTVGESAAMNSPAGWMDRSAKRPLKIENPTGLGALAIAVSPPMETLTKLKILDREGVKNSEGKDYGGNNLDGARIHDCSSAPEKRAENRKPHEPIPEASLTRFTQLVYQLQNRPAATL
jgi:hypothetical protein